MDFKRARYLAIFAFFPVFSFPSFGQKLLSLKDTLQISLEQSPQLDSGKRKIRVLESTVSNRNAARLPQLDLKTLHGFEKFFSGNRSANGAWNSRVSLELKENLYDGGSNNAELRIAKLELEAGTITYEEKRDRLILDVSLLFFELSQQKMLIEDAKKKHELTLKQFNFVNQGFQAGIKQKKDVQRLQARLERAEIDWTRAVGEKAKTKLRLNTYLFFDPTDLLEFEYITMDQDLFQRDRFEFKSEDFYTVKAAKLNTDIQSIQMDLAKHQYTPEILATASASYGFYDYLGDNRNSWRNNRNSWRDIGNNWDNKDRARISVGIEVNYPLWDWGTNRNKIRITTEQKVIAENSKVQIQQDIEERFRIEKEGLEFAKKEHSINVKLLKIEEANFVSLEKDYKKGQVPYLDLINALDDLSSARLSVVTSFYQILKSKAQLTYFQGKIYAWASR